MGAHDSRHQLHGIGNQEGRHRHGECGGQIDASHQHVLEAPACVRYDNERNARSQIGSHLRKPSSIRERRERVAQRQSQRGPHEKAPEKTARRPRKHAQPSAHGREQRQPHAAQNQIPRDGRQALLRSERKQREHHHKRLQRERHRPQRHRHPRRHAHERDRQPHERNRAGPRRRARAFRPRTPRSPFPFPSRRRRFRVRHRRRFLTHMRFLSTRSVKTAL